ncbi:hypothetical protein MA05_06210 [Comamonas aquatica]|nr:hypothetical protein MA05_06210 [Comamonas aquatica]
MPCRCWCCNTPRKPGTPRTRRACCTCACRAAVWRWGKRYAIRKAQAPDQLSSFEAAALALARLHAWEAGHPAWAQLLQSFEAAMALHQRLQAAGRAPPGD